MSIKKVLRRLFNRAGFDIVRYTPPPEPDLDIFKYVLHYALSVSDDFFFVQIGANDGVRADPISSYVKRLGLKGLLVEPLPDVFEELKSNYASESQLQFANVAVSESMGAIKMYRFHPEADVNDDFQGMATLRKGKLERLAKRVRIEGRIEEVSVESVTARSLFTAHGIQKISMLLIDAEGYDLRILRDVFDIPVHPLVVQFEHVNLSKSERAYSRRLLKDSSHCREVHS